MDLDLAKRQFEVSKMYALYWQAVAITGAYKFQKTQRGRKVTPEEKAKGEVIGWRDLTDDEKLENTLSTMQNHIRIMSETADFISTNSK